MSEMRPVALEMIASDQGRHATARTISQSNPKTRSTRTE
jgi:hypothetical protein